MASVTMTVLAILAASESVSVHYDAFSLSQLQCIIGDNAAMDEHRAGYNGLFALTAPGNTTNVFVPLYAGLNLEHYFDAGPVPENDAIFFEPRRAAMTFTKIDDHTAELYQPTTPVYAVESWTRFTLVDSCYVDMSFRCIPHRNDLTGKVLGVFWASYINYPLDKSIYFLGEGSTLDAPQWVQYCTLQHGRDSTVCHEADNHTIPFESSGGALFASLAPVRYSEPFFYGCVGGQVLIYIFRPGPCVRFSHSPSGGGSTPDGQAQNPAWDFQLILPDYEVEKEYTLEMRLVYKPWKDREDILDEVRRYLKRE